MIKCNLSEIMGKEQLKISNVSKETKISRPTLTALYYNTGKGIQFDTMNELCCYLDITPADLFDFTPVEIDIKITSFEYNSELDSAEDEFIYFDVIGLLIYTDNRKNKREIELFGICSAMEGTSSSTGTDNSDRVYDYGDCTIGVKNKEDLNNFNKIIGKLSLGFIVYVKNMMKNNIAEHSVKKGIKKVGNINILQDMTVEEYLKKV